MRRALGKRTHNAFQDVFKSHNKSRRIQLRYIYVVGAICLLFITTTVIYQVYLSRHHDIYDKQSNNKYQTPMQSFMDPNAKTPINNNRKQHNSKTQWRLWDNTNSKALSLHASVLKNLNSEKVKASELQTSYVEDYDIAAPLIPYTRLSWEEECESSSFQAKHYYDYLINENEIDFVFPANDRELYRLFHSKEFLTHWDTSFLNDEYWDLVLALDSEQESAKSVAYLKKKYDEFNNENNDGSERRLAYVPSANPNKYFDFNGLTSDLELFSKNVESIGKNGLYWYTSEDCVHHKSCDVYAINRVLSKSKLIPCKEILTEILPPLYQCIKAHGKDCENVIDSGYFRIIMKTFYAKTGENIVIKMMKPKSIKKDRDYIRHIRESILLGHLYDLEQKYLDAEKTSFMQSLSNGESVKKRGFYYVEEYGHCVTPLWISVSPLYKMPLDKWILNGYAKASALAKLVFMSLQISYSVELLHTLPGGPFHHTDIQPRQFLLDDNDNVFINDFNRGKFQPYYFDGENAKIEKCWYCGHRSRGHWRAPEEPKKRPLNEKLDIFSMGLTIWALYSNEIPFREATFDDLTFLYYDLRRIPPMPQNMPPAIKDIVLSCLKWDPRQRPTASTVVSMLEEIYFINLDVVTEGFQHITSQELLDQNFWSETNYPPKNKRETNQVFQGAIHPPWFPPQYSNV